MKPFAVFALFQSGNKFIATTRPSDRANDDEGEGSFGLPGGKVDAGESPEAALLRECKEEGWEVSSPEFVHCAEVQGKIVFWYKVKTAKKLVDFKEKNRVAPVLVGADKLRGFGNEKAIAAFLSLQK